MQRSATSLNTENWLGGAQPKLIKVNHNWHPSLKEHHRRRARKIYETQRTKKSVVRMCLPAVTGKLGPRNLNNTAASTQDRDSATVGTPAEMRRTSQNYN